MHHKGSPSSLQSTYGNRRSAGQFDIASRKEEKILKELELQTQSAKRLMQQNLSEEVNEQRQRSFTTVVNGAHQYTNEFFRASPTKLKAFYNKKKMFFSSPNVSFRRSKNATPSQVNSSNVIKNVTFYDDGNRKKGKSEKDNRFVKPRIESAPVFTFEEDQQQLSTRENERVSTREKDLIDFYKAWHSSTGEFLDPLPEISTKIQRGGVEIGDDTRQKDTIDQSEVSDDVFERDEVASSEIGDDAFAYGRKRPSKFMSKKKRLDLFLKQYVLCCGC